MNLGPKGGIDNFKRRRTELLSQLKDGVAIITAAAETVRNNDVHYPYRQDSAFYYLTGFTEPESVVVLDPASKTPFTLFVREKDPTRELWDGYRYGVEGAKEHFGADQVFLFNEFESKLPELIKGAEKIYYKIGENALTDKIIFEGIDKARRMKGRSGMGVPALVDVKQMIGEMRLIKSGAEIELMRKACEISAHGHVAGMRGCKPGMFEYQVEALVEGDFRKRGAERLGYTSIVGSGANATVLHYIFNHDECKKDDLLLIDAGAEYGYVTGDITRTFPVGGKFSAPQKKFYEAVLKVQKSCIDMIKPGLKFAEVHQYATEALTEQMLELGLLKGSKKELVEKRAFFKYFPHGTGHWLGMDVHDSGLYNKGGESRRLEAGMCFTVEPGLYVPANDKDAPPEYRGFGVRIEDDVLVTKTGVEVMTSLVPKEVDEIEAIVGRAE